MERTSSLDLFRGSDAFSNLAFLDGQQPNFDTSNGQAAAQGLQASQAISASSPASSRQLTSPGQRTSSKLLHTSRLTPGFSAWPQTTASPYATAALHQPSTLLHSFHPFASHHPTSTADSQADGFAALLADDTALGFADDCFRRESDLYLSSDRLIKPANAQPAVQNPVSPCAGAATGSVPAPTALILEPPASPHDVLPAQALAESVLSGEHILVQGSVSAGDRQAQFTAEDAHASDAALKTSPDQAPKAADVSRAAANDLAANKHTQQAHAPVLPGTNSAVTSSHPSTGSTAKSAPSTLPPSTHAQPAPTQPAAVLMKKTTSSDSRGLDRRLQADLPPRQSAAANVPIATAEAAAHKHDTASAVVAAGAAAAGTGGGDDTARRAAAQQGPAQPDHQQQGQQQQPPGQQPTSSGGHPLERPILAVQDYQLLLPLPQLRAQGVQTNAESQLHLQQIQQSVVRTSANHSAQSGPHAGASTSDEQATGHKEGMAGASLHATSAACAAVCTSCQSVSSCTTHHPTHMQFLLWNSCKQKPSADVALFCWDATK